MSELATRFVGGRDVTEAAETSLSLRSKGYRASLYYLGEYVEDVSLIKRSVTELLAITGKLAELKLETHISVDPTQIGHQVNKEMCCDNARMIAQEIKRVRAGAAATSGDLLMLDMEDSSVTTATIALYELLRRESLPAAVTLRAYLFRSEDDLKRIVQSGGAVRLVKGAFAENDDIAFTRRSEIDRNYLRLAKFMLSEEARTTSFYPAFATHDQGVIDEIVKTASRGGWKQGEYEFEMLYGVRRDLQEKLIQSGQRLRLYIPFGKRLVAIRGATGWRESTQRKVPVEGRGRHLTIMGSQSRERLCRTLEVTGAAEQRTRADRWLASARRACSPRAFGGHRMRPTVVLQSERLVLRTLDGVMPSSWKRCTNGQVTRTLLRIQGPISVEEAREFCQAPAAACGDHRFGAALQPSGNLIALGSVRRHTEPPDVATIGYSVLPAFWGQGFGTEMAALLVEFATGSLGALEVHATTLDDHAPSAGILTKLGFRVVEVGACEVDSRGDDRRVTRWLLQGRSRTPLSTAEPQAGAARLDAGRSA
jgi:proline dehydrogenase